MTITELNKYQGVARETAIYPVDMKIVYPTLGLTGEAGEVADKVKKVFRDNNGYLDEEYCHAIAMKLGDVLWYVANLATDLGYTLQDIAEMNYQKLQSRKERNKLSGEGDDR